MTTRSVKPTFFYPPEKRLWSSLMIDTPVMMSKKEKCNSDYYR